VHDEMSKKNYKQLKSKGIKAYKNNYE